MNGFYDWMLPTAGYLIWIVLILLVIRILMRAKEYVHKYLIMHEFIKRLHQRYQLEGIEIPFPIRTIYMKNGVSRS